jgi:hypothetical protein
MTFQDGSSERLLVTPLAPNLYRLEDSPVLGKASYHDIVETEPQTDGTIRFVRVVTPSGLKTVSWIVPKVQIESPALAALLDSSLQKTNFRMAVQAQSKSMICVRPGRRFHA